MDRFEEEEEEEFVWRREKKGEKSVSVPYSPRSSNPSGRFEGLRPTIAFSLQFRCLHLWALCNIHSFSFTGRVASHFRGRKNKGSFGSNYSFDLLNLLKTIFFILFYLIFFYLNLFLKNCYFFN